MGLLLSQLQGVVDTRGPADAKGGGLADPRLEGPHSGNDTLAPTQCLQPPASHAPHTCSARARLQGEGPGVAAKQLNCRVECLPLWASGQWPS